MDIDILCLVGVIFCISVSYAFTLKGFYTKMKRTLITVRLFAAGLLGLAVCHYVGIVIIYMVRRGV